MLKDCLFPKPKKVGNYEYWTILLKEPKEIVKIIKEKASMSTYDAIILLQYIAISQINYDVKHNITSVFNLVWHRHDPYKYPSKAHLLRGIKKTNKQYLNFMKELEGYIENIVLVAPDLDSGMSKFINDNKDMISKYNEYYHKLANMIDLDYIADNIIDYARRKREYEPHLRMHMGYVLPYTEEYNRKSKIDPDYSQVADNIFGIDRVVKPKDLTQVRYEILFGVYVPEPKKYNNFDIFLEPEISRFVGHQPLSSDELRVLTGIKI